MRSICSVFFAGSALMLLSQCTIQDDIYQLQNQVRVVNQKVEALKADTVGDMERRQASSVNKLGQVEDETQRIRSSIEENIAQNSQFQADVNQTIAGMQSSLNSIRQENNVKVAELNEKIAQLDAKILRMGESLGKAQQARWKKRKNGPLTQHGERRRPDKRLPKQLVPPTQQPAPALRPELLLQLEQRPYR